MAVERAEVIIVGAGVMGASIAFHLTQRGVRDILILEKSHLAAGASGKTGALLRQHYSNIPELMLVHRSVQMFRDWNEIVGGDCGYEGTGLIATVYQSGPDDPNVSRMYANVAKQRQVGIRSEVVTAAQLKELQPFDDVTDIVCAAYESEGGVVDAVATVRSLIAAAVDRGARLREGVTVTAIRSGGGYVGGVETSEGPVDAPVVVACANTWSRPLLETAGVDVPIEVMRVPVAILERPPAMAAGHMAYVDTAAGMFCRMWKPGQTLAGVATAEHHSYVDPDTYDQAVDAAYGAAAIAQIAKRMPPMREARFVTGWAGLYDMSPDTHPILDCAPDVDGLWLLAGFSGAGFKKAPAIGECMAQRIVGQEPAVDLTPFRLSRFADDSWRQPWSDTEYVFSTDFGHIF
jgi:sarcosine oxidase subunit beta